MIPHLSTEHACDAETLELLRALEARGFSGEVRTDFAARLVAGTDNSVYQVLPEAVVFPRSTEDVALLLMLGHAPRFRHIRLSPRGGGTGTNGQSLSPGVVIDLSRHMNRVLEVRASDGAVRVQPGVVLDQLNEELAPTGLFFAPSLSPSNRATIGGMINTDACGKGSRIYGRTSDHVLALTVVLTDGTVHEVRPLSPDELEAARSRDDLVGRVHRVVSDVARSNRALIADTFPKLQRFMTGYNLAMVLSTDGRFDLSRLIAGSEGTLGVVTEATLRIVPAPRHKRLVLLRYGSFDDALASAEALLARDPAAIETIDEKVLGLSREDIVYHKIGHLLDVPGEPPPRTINLVELVGDEAFELDARMDALLSDVARHRGEPGWPTSATVAPTAKDAKALWELRKKGVGLLGNAKGERKPSPFVEDTVVPPARLAAYVRELRALLDSAGLTYGMFGHVDVGCLHVRPALDMKDPGDERLLRRLSDEVAEMTARYGGMLWGEHGKGYRSEYNPQFFGPDLYRELCRVKGAFDPDNRLNPGKIATPYGSGESLVSVDAVKRGAFDRQVLPELRQQYAVAMHCNGNGACFTYDVDTVMCPSWKETRDRIHSPKGRASLVREWLRRLSVAGWAPGAERGPGAFMRWVDRVIHTVEGHRDDYSHQVYDAMAGCLSCKACATQCPVKVDVPAFKADFLELYHGRYLRPLRDHFVAALEPSLPLMARAPRLFNAVIGSPPFQWFMREVVGIVDTPALATKSVVAGLRERGMRLVTAAEVAALGGSERTAGGSERVRERLAPTADVTAGRGTEREQTKAGVSERVRESLAPTAEMTALGDRERTVVLVQDAFTTFYEPEVVLAVVDLLTTLGWRVAVLPWFETGKGLHVKGFLRRFEKVARRATAILEEAAQGGVPMVGIEPAVVLCLRDEVPRALGLAAPPYRIELLQEWLASALAERGAGVERLPGGQAWALYGHCTEKALAPPSQEQWVAVFRALGLELRVENVGCCGMSGMYGHEACHQEETRGIYEKGWDAHLPETLAARKRVVATGTSCRSQVDRFSGFAPLHPAQALVRALRGE